MEPPLLRPFVRTFSTGFTALHYAARFEFLHLLDVSMK